MPSAQVHSIFMSLPPDTVGEGIISVGCPVVPFVRPPSVHSFVPSSGQVLLPRYLMNGLNNFDKTDSEYSVVAIDDLFNF